MLRCTHKKIIPVAPYLISLQYLNDEVIEDFELGMEVNHECLHRRYINEFCLFGDRISSGMRQEIELEKEMNIPIFPKTDGTKKDFENIKFAPSDISARASNVKGRVLS